MLNMRKYIFKRRKCKMIKILMGEKGTGKTKKLIDMANRSVSQSSGDVVFIDKGTRYMYDLSHEIRFIDVSQFEIEDLYVFYGFICGIIAGNFDISQIYIDRIFNIVDDSMDSLKKFLIDIEKISQDFNIEFVMTISGDAALAPEYVKQYIA